MADLPYMMMNWGRFFTDAKVAALPTEVQGIYALLLGRMWLNQGWLKADDKIIAHALNVDVRRWKLTYKPHIVPLLRGGYVEHVGAIYSQKHLAEVRETALEYVAKRTAQTARARAVKAAKHGNAGSVTERALAPVTKPVSAPVTEPVTSVKLQPQKNSSLTSQSERAILSAPTADDTALPPREGTPLFGTHGGPILDDEPAPPSDPDLRKRLVAEGLKPKPKGGLLGSLNMGK
jgi:uncharacterized protein YdaU (DUF1376 family)